MAKISSVRLSHKETDIGELYNRMRGGFVLSMFDSIQKALSLECCAEVELMVVVLKECAVGMPHTSRNGIFGGQNHASLSRISSHSGSACPTFIQPTSAQCAGCHHIIGNYLVLQKPLTENLRCLFHSPRDKKNPSSANQV